MFSFVVAGIYFHDSLLPEIHTYISVLVVKNWDANGVLTNNGNENDPDIDGETSTGLESGDKVWINFSKNAPLSPENLPDCPYPAKSFQF